jgi:hypothetical protein
LLLIGFLPLFTYDVVPLLESVSVDFKITVLRPSSENLDLIETLLEITSNLSLKLACIGLKLDPEVVGIRESLLV